MLREALDQDGPGALQRLSARGDALRRINEVAPRSASDRVRVGEQALGERLQPASRAIWALVRRLGL